MARSAKCKMQNRNEGRLFEKIKEKLRSNIFFHSLPYAILISALTIIGLFGGFAVGKGLGSSIAGFVFSLFFSLLGFFLGLFISYFIVKVKYPIRA
jgi:Zn-dependent protease with chaperone function